MEDLHYNAEAVRVANVFAKIESISNSSSVPSDFFNAPEYSSSLKLTRRAARARPTRPRADAARKYGAD
ncbi:MAG: hypothetical protein KIT48_18535 [Pseudolabrys sp.]|nr:hypothetical protein [Pseudolabrys sp.]